MKVLLINASWPSYNLGMEKARRKWIREGWEVDLGVSYPRLMGKVADVVWVSAIFSWDVQKACDEALAGLEAGCEVEVGGPGTFGVRGYVKSRTGLEAQSWPDPRFEREPGEYRAVFWSRGCPAKNCTLGFPRNGALPICSVPEMEGWKFTLYPDVKPARVIMDNNLSALPKEHQELIVERTLACGFASVDANSGFEPRSIRPWVVELWKRLPLVAWRFAYDEVGEREAVLRTVRILHEFGVSRKKMHIYCLAGNEPVEACEHRVQEINEWGCMAIVQRRRPLDWLGNGFPLPCLHDWNEQLLIDFQRWGTRLAKGERTKMFSSYRRGLHIKPVPRAQLRIL